MIEISHDIALAPFTSFGIGGPARHFVRARGAGELREALRFAREEGLPFFILGGGSNLLVSDAGFDGVVVRLEADRVVRRGERIEVEAGADLNLLVGQAASWGLAGLEPLAGIPGMLGGAVRGNAGAYGGSIGELAERVLALDARTLEEVSLPGSACRFSYRLSRFKGEPELIVLSALLALAPGSPGAIRQRVAETLAKRAARGLSCQGSVGSYFMNPTVEDPELVARFEADQKARSREGRIPAGWLIDQAGLRNLRVGAAQVSPRHANYLINTGGASAAQVLELARLVRERVLEATGVLLKEEVSLVGFS